MSDHDRFADFLPPGKGFEIPARAGLYQRLTTLGTAMQDDFMRVLETLPEDDKTDIKKSLDTTQDGSLEPILGCYFKPELLPAKLYGADAVKLGHIFMPDAGVSMLPPEIQSRHVELEVELYKDGSPYVPEELYQRGITDNRFTVVATPDSEQPPFIVNNQDLFAKTSSGEEEYLSTEEYMAKKHAAGESLAFVSDEECSGIATIAGQLKLDIKRTAFAIGAIITEPNV